MDENGEVQDGGWRIKDGGWKRGRSFEGTLKVSNRARKGRMRNEMEIGDSESQVQVTLTYSREVTVFVNGYGYSNRCEAPCPEHFALRLRLHLRLHLHLQYVAPPYACNLCTTLNFNKVRYFSSSFIFSSKILPFSPFASLTRIAPAHHSASLARLVVAIVTIQSETRKSLPQNISHPISHRILLTSPIRSPCFVSSCPARLLRLWLLGLLFAPPPTCS